MYSRVHDQAVVTRLVVLPTHTPSSGLPRRATQSEADKAPLSVQRCQEEDQHMSSSDIDQAAGRAEVSRAAGGAEPTQEERAAAAEVLRMIWGIHISRAVYVVAELGIADLLAGGPMTAAHLAQATQTHEPSLYRVLRLLASLGVLTEHDHHSFSLTVLGERLRADVPASMRSMALTMDAAGHTAVRAHHRDRQDGEERLRHRVRDGRV